MGPRDGARPSSAQHTNFQFGEPVDEATHILALEGESNVVWFTGSYADYEADRKKRLGAAADRPHRIKYRKLTKN